MSNRILHTVVVLLFTLNLGTTDAQLFKGKTQRQSGGSNSMQQQPQQRGGLFQKGRERRESNQSNNGQSFNNNSVQQQTKSGLFKKNRQPQQSSNGAPVKQGGLFKKAKERKLQEQNQATYQNQNRSYTNSNSQSSNSYVRSNQKVTGASPLFNQSANQLVRTNAAPSSAAQSGGGSTLPSQQQQSVSANASRLEAQPVRSQLPSLVSATAERQADRPQPPAVTPTNLKNRLTTRPKLRPGTVNASLLKEKAPPAPDARPTSNKLDLRRPKVEVTAAVLA